MKKLRKPIYKLDKISYKGYKYNFKSFKIPDEQIEKYIAVLEIGIIKELEQQGILKKDEMLEIIKQIKKKKKIGVEI